MKTLTSTRFKSTYSAVIALLFGAFIFASPGVWAGEKSSKKASATEQRMERVNINKAGIPQLTQLTGVGEKKAIAIVQYRSKHGKFRSIDQLTDVKGIGDKIVEENRARLAI